MEEVVDVLAPFLVVGRPPLMVAAVSTAKLGRRVGGSLRLVVVSVCGGFGGKKEFALARHFWSIFVGVQNCHPCRHNFNFKTMFL